MSKKLSTEVMKEVRELRGKVIEKSGASEFEGFAFWDTKKGIKSSCGWQLDDAYYGDEPDEMLSIETSSVNLSIYDDATFECYDTEDYDEKDLTVEEVTEIINELKEKIK